MRIGQNPAKFTKTVARPERITVAVLNYIPFLSGYYTEMLEVLKVCLNSIRETADLPFDLLVFDNGSCEEAFQYLVDEKQAGRIQHLILSEKNLGKGGAWNAMLAGAPGEVIAYADSDVLFYPKWLSRSVELLETFPDVGMVTARPFRTNPDFYNHSLAWAQKNVEVTLQHGQLIPFETLHEFNLSLGQSDADSRHFIETSEDVHFVYRGVHAFAGASHWQFTCYKSVITQFLPFEMDRPMGQVKQLDQRVNAAGLLRLMVSDPLAMNMSNSLTLSNPAAGNKKIPRRIANLPFVKNALLDIYNKIFDLYYK
jgi:glycosyltransferase involved in cell wall biosynthesis